LNVLIVNAYSARNRGDGMIVNQMIRMLEARGCDVRVMSDDPSDRDRYPVPTHLPPVRSWPGAGYRPTRARLVCQLARAFLWPPIREGPFAWADLCVSAGGGYLWEDGRWGVRFSLAHRLVVLRAARRAGLPLVMFSQSIGPFRSRLVARAVARELRHAALVLVREERSLETCRTLGVARVELCDDAAFALRPPSSPPAGLPRVAPGTIGVTVIGELPGVDRGGHEAYLRALASALAEAALEAGAPVAVISQVSAHAGDDDLEVCGRLVGLLGDAGVAAGLHDLSESSEEALAAFYGRLRLVVATRLHSGILALCAGTPVIALGYLPKTDGVFARLGRSDLVLEAAGLEPAALAALVRRALAEEEGIVEHVRARLVEMRASAERAADLALAAAGTGAGLAAARPRRSDRLVRALKRGLRRALETGARQIGFDLVRRTVYSPVPDVRSLPEATWARPSPLPGVELEPERHIAFLERHLARHLTEFRPPLASTGVPGEFHLANASYESVDAEVYYAMVRYAKPRRILELGSGFSTLVGLAACERNRAEGHPVRYEAYDPSPREVVTSPAPRGLDRLHRTGAAEVTPARVAELDTGDILFVDTTHTVKVGGEVNHIVLEMLPALAPGVLVHFHDVFLPWEYPREWIERERLFWAEQYLLQAFLAFNPLFEVLFAAHAVARVHPDRLGRAVPSFYSGLSTPKAFWIRRRAGPAESQGSRGAASR